MSAKLIETPYGRKTPELLCKAMDAYELQHELTTALNDLLNYTGGWDLTDPEHPIVKARAVIAKATE